jgi:hypothetical protein
LIREDDLVEYRKIMEREKYVTGLSDRFIKRRDIFAKQRTDGSYISVKKPYIKWLMHEHLKGSITLGAYVLNEKSEASYIVLDADTEAQFGELKELSKKIEAPSYLETSRRGGHLWMFFDHPIPGKLAKGFGDEISKGFKLEVFPKQVKLSGGPGSLIRVPFGVHQKTGERYKFINPNGEPLGDWKTQMKELINAKTVSPEVILNHQSVEKPKYHPGEKYRNLLEIPLIDFIGSYVDLKPIASGGLGKCPFHEDDKPSFGVSIKGNFWNCFAGCGGGNIINFWMKYKNLSFHDAVEELEKMG